MPRSPDRPTNLPEKKLKKRHNFWNNCPIWLKFCMKLPLKMRCHWHETELGKKNFSSNNPPSQKWYLYRFFQKAQNFFEKFRNMISHDCLNIFIKNLTVILISSLYLTKFIISTLAKKCVIRPNLYEKWAHVRKSKYQFIHDIRLATWWCMVLFNFQHFKIDGFHSVHGPFSMTLTKTKKRMKKENTTSP